MPTYPTNRCDAQRHETEDVRGATIRLDCKGISGHAGPHLTDTGLYWSTENWLEQLNRAWSPTDETKATELIPDVADAGFDPTIRPWRSITIDGLTIPATMFLTKGLDLDVQHGHVTLTFRVREGVTVVMRDGSPEDVSPRSEDYFNTPVRLDFFNAPSYVLAQLPHVHDLDGICRKRRDGDHCPPPDDRPDLAGGGA